MKTKIFLAALMQLKMIIEKTRRRCLQTASMMVFFIIYAASNRIF